MAARDDGSDPEHSESLVIIDLSLVPSDVIHVAVGRHHPLIFEALQRQLKTDRPCYRRSLCWKRLTPLYAGSMTKGRMRRQRRSAAKPSSA